MMPVRPPPPPPPTPMWCGCGLLPPFLYCGVVRGWVCLGWLPPWAPVTWCGFACGGSPLRVWVRTSRGCGVSGAGPGGGGDTMGVGVDR